MEQYGRKNLKRMTGHPSVCMACVLAVLLSNLSQLPALTSTRTTNVLSTPTWIVFGIFLLNINGFRIKFNQKTLQFYQICLVFVALVGFLTLTTGGSQINGSMFRAFRIAILVFTVGCVSSDFLDKKTIDWMELAYVLTMCVVGLNIYQRYFIGYDLSSSIYGYSSKNSVSTMVLAAIIFLIFGMQSLKAVRKMAVLRWSLVGYFIVLMGLMKSRSSLVGLGIVLLAVMLNKEVKTWFKVALICLLAGAVFVVLTNLSIYDVVFNDIIFAGRDSTNISSISSGRTDLIAKTLTRLANSPLAGLGAYYIDCYPVSALANYGVIIGWVIIYLSVKPLLATIRDLHKNAELYDIRYTLLVLAAAYSVNSLFEGLPPFGPGIKCYILWFLFGVLTNFDESRSLEALE